MELGYYNAIAMLTLQYRPIDNAFVLSINAIHCRPTGIRFML